MADTPPFGGRHYPLALGRKQAAARPRGM